MLAADFDDSGTHNSSEVVLVGGICGTEIQLSSLDSKWKRHLDEPLGGQKQPLRRFHMYDCQNSLVDFSGWNRTETEYFVHQLGDTIIKSGVGAYGIACVRAEYDSLVKGDVRAIFGTPEQMCIRNCFVKAVSWAQNEAPFDPKLTFVFDNRPNIIQKDAQVVSHARAGPGNLHRTISGVSA
jgi:hypothetical protein